MIHVAWSQGVLPEEEVPAMPREVKEQGASRGCRSLGPVGMRDGQREQRYRKLEGPTKARSQKALNARLWGYGFPLRATNSLYSCILERRMVYADLR